MEELTPVWMRSSVLSEVVGKELVPRDPDTGSPDTSP